MHFVEYKIWSDFVVARTIEASVYVRDAWPEEDQIFYKSLVNNQKVNNLNIFAMNS